MPLINVLDSTMHYEETTGNGTPIVFLHGNPSSSHQWRNVLPTIANRTLAPDLIGMGRSGKPNIEFRIEDHIRYLDAWFDAMALDDVVLVGHDWGGVLAFNWAARHSDRVHSVVFFETIMKPMRWEELGDGPRSRTEAMRGPKGEELILDQTFFIETAYTGGVLNPLSPEELAPYLAPYPTRESRRPILEWARSLPLDGEPANVAAIITHNDEWLASSPGISKLLLTFEGSPTLSINPGMKQWCVDNIDALTVQHCGAAGHHATEDQPDAIATAINDWLALSSLMPPFQTQRNF